MSERLLLLRPALEPFCNKFNISRGVLETSSRREVADHLRSRRFLDSGALIAALLMPVFIGIGLIERRSSNLSDLDAIFRRLYACKVRLRQRQAKLQTTGAR